MPPVRCAEEPILEALIHRYKILDHCSGLPVRERFPSPELEARSSPRRYPDRRGALPAASSGGILLHGPEIRWNRCPLSSMVLPAGDVVSVLLTGVLIPPGYMGAVPPSTLRPVGAMR